MPCAQDAMYEKRCILISKLFDIYPCACYLPTNSGITIDMERNMM